MKLKKQFKSGELNAIRQKIIEKTGVKLDDCIIEQAFTRSSYSNQYGGSNNENLEYIGDTILGYHVVKHLYDRYHELKSSGNEYYYSFRAHEKDFTNLKSTIVSNHTLAAIIDEWDVVKYLVVGQSDVDNEIDKQEKIKADLFEAIIGAVAVKCNWNQELMGRVVSKVLPIEQFIDEYEKTQERPAQHSAENAITTLKELAEQGKCAVPQYVISGPESIGYDRDGRPKWFCSCTLNEPYIVKAVFANSQKDAKKYASYLVLCDMFERTNEYGSSSSLKVWYYYNGHLDFAEPESFRAR